MCMEKIIKQLSETTDLLYHEVYQKLCIKKKYGVGGEQIFAKIQSLDIPNTAQIYEVTPAYTLLEYIEGQSLRELLELYGELTVDFTIYLVKEICKALAVMHDNSIIHKDIKPENIIVSGEDKHVCLIDFDVTRIITENKDRDTELFGTRGYASPEHYGFKATDNRSDIYSLGMLMKDCTRAETLQPVIAKCTEVDPDNRYQSIAEVVQALSDKKEKKPVKEREPIYRGWVNITALSLTTIIFLFLVSSFIFDYKPILENVVLDRVSASLVYLLLAMLPSFLFLTVMATVYRFILKKKINFKRVLVAHGYLIIACFVLAILFIIIGSYWV